jgi:hypothetical protein
MSFDRIVSFFFSDMDAEFQGSPIGKMDKRTKEKIIRDLIFDPKI